MRDKALRPLVSPFAPYALFTAVSLLVHCLAYVPMGDDLSFAHALDGQSIWQYGVFLYQNWSSRLLIQWAFLLLLLPLDIGVLGNAVWWCWNPRPWPGRWVRGDGGF